jgi:hypothetical protein
MSEPGTDLYAALANGDPQALARCRIAPGVAALALAARKKRLTSAPTSPKASAPPRAPASVTSARPTTAPRPSLAEIHLAGVNASRTRCGLEPLSMAELEREFADVDREPPHTMTKAAARRAAANAMAARQGLSTNQTAIDHAWSESAQKLNATLPVKRSAAGPEPVQAQHVDWSAITTKLNAEAGLKTPSRPR